MLFDRDGNQMTPSHAVKNGTRYCYYVSRPLIIKDQSESLTGLRIPAAEIERLVTSRVRQWLLDPGSVYQATRLSDASAQRRLVVRAAEIGKSWPELPAARQRAFLTTLIERIDVGADRIDIRFRPTWLRTFLDVAAMRSSSATDTRLRSCPSPYGCAAAGERSQCCLMGPTRPLQRNPTDG
jgi:hypothetical protein